MQLRIPVAAWVVCALLAGACARDHVRTAPAEAASEPDAGPAREEPGPRATHLEAPRPAEWEPLPAPRRDLPPLTPSAKRPAGQAEEPAAEPAPPPEQEAGPAAPPPAPGPIVASGQEPHQVRVWYATDRARASDVDRGDERRARAVLHGIAGLVLLLALLWWTRKRTRRTRAVVAGVVGAAAAVVVVYDLVPKGEAADEVFGVEQADGLSLGTCDVTIPPVHERGQVERPAARRFELVEDPSDHVVLREVTHLDEEAFWSGAAEAMGRERAALVFVHGGDTSFSEAARRTGQLAWDLDLPGAPILYSWPSRSGWFSRDHDEEAAAATVPHLRAFLARVHREAGGGRVHLVAHGLGARALGEALREQAPEPGDPRRFRTVALITPDVKLERFRQDIAPAARAAAERVTVYASENDAILSLVGEAGGPRQVGEEAPTLQGVDTVDASRVDTSLADRQVTLEDPPLVADLRRVLRAEPPPRAPEVAGGGERGPRPRILVPAAKP